MIRPANQDCYRVDVLTGVDEIIANPDCHLRARKSILMERLDWETVKKSLYGACISEDCKTSLDLISSFFEQIDAAVGSVVN